jgi:hypothetical protein
VAAPKKYPAELRARAVRLYRESDPTPVIRRLAEQLGVHRQHVFRPGVRPDPAAVMRFIDEHRGQFAVAVLLRVLDIAESTYYGWLKQTRQPSDRAMVDRGLLSNIYEIRTNSRRTYGSDRVWRQLRRGGFQVSRKRVERLMRQQGWQGAFLRRGWRHGSTRQDPKAVPAPDRVQRDFTAPAPNPLWVADATRIPCGEGVFWLAAVRDAFSSGEHVHVLANVRRAGAPPGNRNTRHGPRRRNRLPIGPGHA